MFINVFRYEDGKYLVNLWQHDGNDKPLLIPVRFDRLTEEEAITRIYRLRREGWAWLKDCDPLCPNITADKVREYLPDVDVLGHDGKVHRGKVKGRQNDFSMVWWWERSASGQQVEMGVAWAWSTIANALQRGIYLRVDPDIKEIPDQPEPMDKKKAWFSPDRRTLLDTSEKLANPAQLTEWAARAAADELVSNWESSLSDGYKLGELLGDVDQVVQLLQEWRDSIKNTIKVG